MSTAESAAWAAVTFLRGSTAAGAAAALLIAAGCAPLPSAVPDSVDDFPRAAASDTIATGYSRISERYLDGLSVETAAIEGLRGLATIDPALTVDRHSGTVDLLAGNRVVGSFPAPAPDDSAGWAALTVDVAAAGRQVSRGMRAASAEKIYEAVFDGALSQLDIFSRYAGADEAREHRAKRDGFGGIGIAYVVASDAVQVTQVMADSPAKDAGLAEGDLIVGIDGAPTAGMTAHGVSTLLRGPVGSRLELDVRHGKQPAARTMNLYRAHIVPGTVRTSRERGVLTAAIATFNQNTAASLTKEIETAMRQPGEPVVGIVLDLRGNPGGLLKQAVRVVDLFLAKGSIVDTAGRHPDSIQHYAATGEDITGGLPLAVIIDGKSASAAEIVAAALQDQGRAVIIGTTSFGKGTVQTVVHLPNDGEITLTWSRLLSPSGYVLHGLGVLPHICTSGIDDDGDATILKAVTQISGTSDSLAAWRHAGADDRTGRNALRVACPAERRRAGVEARIARRLLTEPPLFAHAMDMASSVAAADAEPARP